MICFLQTPLHKRTFSTVRCSLPPSIPRLYHPIHLTYTTTVQHPYLRRVIIICRVDHLFYPIQCGDNYMERFCRWWWAGVRELPVTCATWRLPDSYVHLNDWDFHTEWVIKKRSNLQNCFYYSFPLLIHKNLLIFCLAAPSSTWCLNSLIKTLPDPSRPVIDNQHFL